MTTSSSPVGAGAPAFRLGAAQRALPILIGALTAGLLLWTCLSFTDQPMTAGELGHLLSWAVVSAVGCAGLTRHNGAQLTDDALVVRTGRSRRIPWGDIHHVEIQHRLGVRRIAVHTRDGRRTVLYAPQSLGDPDFDSKAATIVRWWQERRSAA